MNTALTVIEWTPLGSQFAIRPEPRGAAFAIDPRDFLIWPQTFRTSLIFKLRNEKRRGVPRAPRAPRARCEPQPRTSQQLSAPSGISACGWSIAEGVSSGTLQGWLIPEHGWLQARGGSGGVSGQAESGCSDLEPQGVELGAELGVAPCSNC